MAAVQLVSFQRISIPRNSQRQVTFTMVPEDHARLDSSTYESLVFPGKRSVWVSASSDVARAPTQKMSFTVTGPATPLSKCQRSTFNEATADAARWSPPADELVKR